jgi:hypothetical protein
LVNLVSENKELALETESVQEVTIPSQGAVFVREGNRKGSNGRRRFRCPPEY